jgi:FkbM family methyltransferase
MPSTRRERLGTKLRVCAPWRLALPNRTVRRHVQGVDLYLPWSHRLPDYARTRPTYGQNLIELAAQLNDRGGSGTEPLLVLDVGANIGDSAAQILARTDARVLCVEGDPYWAGYLRKNLGASARATLEEVLLTAEEAVPASANAVRAGGTTRFVENGAGDASLPHLSVTALRDRHPEFAGLRLVKSDTDGLDPVLVPAIARAWSESRPVLFFEFDPILARAAGNDRPNDVWHRLADLGYGPAAIWDNGADPLGRADVTELPEHARVLEPRPVELGYHFWDVAVCHVDDEAARAAFDALVQMPYAAPAGGAVR